MEQDVKVVKTDEGSKTGQDKCPKCGATDISLNVSNGKLRCNYCRCEFESEHINGMVEDISTLEGEVIGSGATNINNDAGDVITLKCSSCGAEVVIDTLSSTQARCHWCRNMLSINEQIPNGAVPDVVLPFGIKKEDAQKAIEAFVGKRKFFAHPQFKKEFTTQNIMGVYFPYMVIDINAHANFSGEGEHLKRRYTVQHGNSSTTYYDADVYEVARDFDVAINGLTVESSADRRNKANKEKTNNVINAIMPFDIENSVKYNSNYLKGFTSEKRDSNVDELKPLVMAQAKDVAKFSVNNTLENYNRGVCWKTQDVSVKGQQWKAAYLPVWLYSYQEVKGDKKLLHYVAVNARTKETMGSVPIHMPKLFLISALIEVLAFLLMLFVDSDYRWIFLIAGFLYFFIIYSKYRNQGARHTYETDTKTNVSNLKSVDKFITTRRGLTNHRINGCNNTTVTGEKASATSTTKDILNSVVESDSALSFIKNNIKK